MKNLLKKLLLVSCVSAMLVTPTSIFANELHKQETLEVIGIPENGIMPIYTDKNQVVIPNGETYYFVNKVNGQPFLFKENTSIDINFAFEGPCMFDCGVIDEDNNIIMSFPFALKNNIEYFSGINSIIPKTGRYRFFVTNYAPDSLIFNEVSININYPE